MLQGVPARWSRQGDRGHSNNGSVNMINHHVPTVSAILVVLAALAAPVNAAEVHEVPAVATPGNAAEATAILGAKLLVCNTCHGADGAPRNANTPIIWGLQENYVLKQLHDFQSGGRDSEVMMWMATALTPGEVGSAAAYFAKKNWPARPAAAAATSPPAVVAVCAACHQQNLVGGLAAPRLAGQRYEYLVEAMRRFAEAVRRQVRKHAAALAGVGAGAGVGAEWAARDQSAKAEAPANEGHDHRELLRRGARFSVDHITYYTPLQDYAGIITPASLHFVQYHASHFPDIDAQQHRLTIHGMVDRPLSFTLEDLKRLPSVSRIHFLECHANSSPMIH